jgi:hypothetical protein
VELARRDNIVPHEDVQSAMSSNLHGCGCIDTRVDEVANGGASEVMGNKAPILIPRFSCLFSTSTLDTCLYPLTPEILRCEYCAVASESLLEDGRELIREGDNQRLAILDDTGRQAYFPGRLGLPKARQPSP